MNLPYDPYTVFWSSALVAAPPAVIVAGMLTLGLTFAVPPSHTAERGQARQVSVRADVGIAEQRAGLHGLSARLRVSEEGVRVELNGRLAERPAQLVVRFVPPGGEAAEFEVLLKESPAGDYRGPLPVPAEGAAAWPVAVEPPNGAWRLWGRFEPGRRVALNHAT